MLCSNINQHCFKCCVKRRFYNVILNVVSLPNQRPFVYQYFTQFRASLHKSDVIYNLALDLVHVLFGLNEQCSIKIAFVRFKSVFG